MLNGVDEDELETALFTRMRWNAPLSEQHAELLMDWMDLRPGLRIADVGCAWGELLLRMVARCGAGASGAGASGAGASGVGVDIDGAALARGRAAARERGLDQQVSFVEGEAASWRGTADRVLCVGAPHAFGGTRQALGALARLIEPGGRLLFGDGYWTADPSQEAMELFGDEVGSLAGLLETCRETGWRPIHLSVADQREWDDFESSYTAGRLEWALAHPEDPRAPEMRDWVDAQQRKYLHVYRGILGFAYLILAR